MNKLSFSNCKKSLESSVFTEIRHTVYRAPCHQYHHLRHRLHVDTDRRSLSNPTLGMNYSLAKRRTITCKQLFNSEIYYDFEDNDDFNRSET